MHLGRAPTGGQRLGFRAEPALALVALDPDAGVPGAPRHVVDLAVAGDIALDGAALGRLLLGGSPALGAILPRRLGLRLPDPEPRSLGRSFLCHVGLAVAHERPGEALADHPGVDVAAGHEADAQEAAVFVDAMPLARHRLAFELAGQGGGGGTAAGPPADQRAIAALAGFGSIDALEPHPGIRDVDGVAVDDAGCPGHRRTVAGGRTGARQA